MKSEILIDFCFMRMPEKGFKMQIENRLRRLFPSTIRWYLDDSNGTQDYDLVVAELKGIGSWQTSEDVLAHLEKEADPMFWTWLQGMQMDIFPVKKGCGNCGH